MQGLTYLLQNVAGKTVLDLGCAEGLIDIELIKHGAVAIHGVEIRPQAIAAANELRGDLPITFEQGDMDEWRPKRTYNVVLMLAILHKLRKPEVVLSEMLPFCSDLLVLRLPPYATNPMVRDERSGGEPIDLNRALTRGGFRSTHITLGYLDEWIGFYRRVYAQ